MQITLRKSILRRAQIVIQIETDDNFKSIAKRGLFLLKLESEGDAFKIETFP